MNKVNPYQFPGKIHSVQRTCEQQVFYDIMPRVLFCTSAFDTAPCDISFVKRVIVPPFFDLLKKWPNAYNLLMRKSFFDFKIKIINYALSCLQIRRGKIKWPAMTLDKTFDKSTVMVNAYDGFSEDFLKKTIYHEIMHAVSNFAVKDKKANKLLELSDHLKENKPEIYKKLKYMSDDYETRTDMLYKDINKSFSDEITPENLPRFHDFSIKKMKEHRCWAYLNTSGCHTNYSESFACRNFLNNDIEQLIAVALSFYLGTDDENKHFKQKAPCLYALTKDVLIPEINKLINGTAI